MKVFLVLALVIPAAAAVLAYGRTEEAIGLVSVAAHTTTAVGTEPAVLFVAGSTLLAIAGAVRRFSL